MPYMGAYIAYVEAIEDHVAGGLGRLLEDLQVLENLRRDFNGIVVPDRVFTQEIEDNLVRRLEGNVFIPQRTTADSVGLVLTLLITSSES
jgi:hypothetical protein